MSNAWTDSLSRGDFSCKDKSHKPHWAVVVRNGNFSAFNGYHFTPSDYSTVRCLVPACRRAWRTKAAYVKELPDAPRGER